MNDSKQNFTAKQEKAEGIRSKLKLAMASFSQYSSDIKVTENGNISPMMRAEQTPDKFQINLTNLSPSADRQKEGGQKFSFLQDTQKVRNLKLI